MLGKERKDAIYSEKLPYKESVKDIKGSIIAADGMWGKSQAEKVYSTWGWIRRLCTVELPLVKKVKTDEDDRNI